MQEKWYYLTETGAAAGDGGKELWENGISLMIPTASMAKDTMVGQYRVDVNGCIYS